MLLQNNDNALKTKTEPRSLQKHLSRQEIVKVYKITWTANDWSLQRDIPIVIIPSSFTQILSIDCSNTIGISDELYRLWVLFRHTKDPDRIQNFSSFASTNSILFCGEGNQATTRVAFTPIIPHLATDRNTINIAMVTFQNVLIKRDLIAHLVSRFACNTRVIDDASSNPPVSNVKSL